MAGSIYNDKLIEPTEKMLSVDLEASYMFLTEIKEFIESEYGHLKPEWKFYNKKTGWLLKLFHKKRNVLFVVPYYKYFRVAFTFGDKATNKILESELPETIKTKLSEAKKYMEGRIIEIDVKNEEEIKYILKLIQIKLEK
ncbi:DUF3788 family protein [Polaribacter sp. SA4-12]|uniref:DUF3788 family protein n=1 Tax=Polaribacter sp. SA4-12 TaxID=1312072 RepID=UPI000B3C9435|nr:DUF3788 family protein [Polaribacter sp. SA4-12]ARV13871.1 hypothetical protein BTO07_01355 [Polaribacter sp. SA4-12]